MTLPIQLDLQKAIYNVLSASAFQTACGVAVGIFDHVPEAAKAPYIIISNLQDEGASTDRYDGSEIHATLKVWSVVPGKVELYSVAGALKNALAPRSDLGPPFTLTAHRLITWKFGQTIPMDDPDGISVSATVMIEYTTEPR